jgi:hypothetical protein
MTVQPKYAALDSIVVQITDVIEAMRRNERDRNEQRNHVLRVTPPFDGDKQASLHVSEPHTHYPSDVTKPLHLSPEAFIVGDSGGARRSDFPNGAVHPRRTEQRRLFRNEYDLYDDETGENLPINGHEDREKQFEEWWDEVCEMWESTVRHELNNTTDITIHSQHPDVDSVTVPLNVMTE